MDAMGKKPAAGTVAIVNPASRDGALRREWPKLQQLLKERGLDCEVFLTERPGHGSEIAFALTSRTPPPALVVAVGGDGTMNEVARGLRGSDIVLGLLPFGRRVGGVLFGRRAVSSSYAL